MPRNSTTTRLDVGGPDPLYRQVEQRILQCLAAGEWKPGGQLPTEGQLAERFGVAVFTIRAGIAELAKSGILVRKQGKGTFVARHSRSRQRYQFSHIHDADGRQLLAGRELVAFGRSVATGREARMLALPPGGREPVLRLGMRSIDGGETVATLDIVLPARLFRALTAATIRNAQENLYAAYQDACGVNVIRIAERVHGGLASTEEARVLKIRTGAPVLRVERVASTYDSVPVEFRTRVFDATRFHYETTEGGV